jgi:hypothetical protein
VWYISPSLQHYQCINIIMRDTGGKRITNTFHYKHHAIPVREVTATDCILKATHSFTVAIERVQEAAPDELQPIKSLHHILLGGKNPQQPCPPPPTHLHDSEINKEPIHTWDPTSRVQTTLPLAATSGAPQTDHAIIDDDDDAPTHPVPAVHTGRLAIIHDNVNAPPIVRCPWTQAQLHTQEEPHLINMVIQDNLMPNYSLAIKPHKLHHSYLQPQAAQALVVQTYVLGADSSHFIGTIIDKETGEYCQLIKIPKYQDI